MMRHPALRAFFRAPSGWLAAGSLGILAAIAVLAPVFLSDAATQGSIMRSGEGPSADYLLGTDNLGRSILARLLVATGLSLVLALAATALAAVLGITLGILVAMAPGRIRTLGLRAIDVTLSFPGILLAIVITAFVGVGPIGAVIAIGIAYVPDFARLSSTLAMSVTSKDFVAAARVLGVPPHRRLLRYILPNIGDSMTVAVFTTTAGALISVSSLSFLGLGVQPPLFDWGRMLAEGIVNFYVTPLAALAPAVMIALAGMALGFFGEALARAMNPLLWSTGDGARAPRATRSGGSLPAPRDIDGTEGGVLSLRDLRVTYPAPGGERMAVVDGVSLDINAGEIVGVVGESGSGKSQTALGIAQLLASPAEVTATCHRFLGADLGDMASEERRRLLGTRLAMVFQDPMGSLNPTIRIGDQIAEPLRLFGGADREAALKTAVERLREVGIPAPEDRLSAYPHEFSGGMQQRAMIAMGLTNRPALLIADEPTTALDVTIQAQVIDLMRDLNREHGTAILLITHNIGVVASVAQRLIVMYAGRIVEDGPISEVLGQPYHPYTRLLLAATPELDSDRDTPLGAIEGRPPTPVDRPRGCAFAARCPHAIPRCRDEDPALRRLGERRHAACHLAEAPKLLEGRA
jgi:oligopeptide/dipeptide ABC transporter ATP-binding protein